MPMNAEKMPRVVARFVRVLIWTPTWLRWDADADHELTWGLAVLFGVVGSFTSLPLLMHCSMLCILALELFKMENEKIESCGFLPSVGFP